MGIEEDVFQDNFADESFVSEEEDANWVTDKVIEDEEIQEITEDENDDFFGQDKGEEELEQQEGKQPEVEEEKEQEQEEELEVEEEEQEDEGDSVFSELNKELISRGIFSEEEQEDEVTSAEQFAEKWERQAKQKANASIQSFISEKFGQEGIEVFNSIFINGISPKEYLSKYVELESVKDIDTTNEEGQKRVFKMFYQDQGFSEDYINRKLQSAIDAGDLEEDVKSLHEKLVQKEEVEFEKMTQEAEQREQQRLLNKQTYVNNLSSKLSNILKEKQLKGFPINEDIAKEVYNSMVYEKWQLVNGQKLTNFDRQLMELNKPENLEKKILLQVILNNDFDFSQMEKVIKSKEKDKAFAKVVQAGKRRTTKKPTNNKNPWESPWKN